MTREAISREPVHPVVVPGEDVVCEGILIREWMATHIMAGILASGPERNFYLGPFQQQRRWADEAVGCADALIAALNAAAKPVSVREDDGQPE